MAILINKDTRIVTQGITGKTGEFHTEQCIAYAYGKDCFVAGVTPGKAGQVVQGVPVLDTVAEAKAQYGVNASVIYVPPRFAAAAIDEAIRQPGFATRFRYRQNSDDTLVLIQNSTDKPRVQSDFDTCLHTEFFEDQFGDFRIVDGPSRILGDLTAARRKFLQ